jgi:AcrR family transcriptional regulator
MARPKDSTTDPIAPTAELIDLADDSVFAAGKTRSATERRILISAVRAFAEHGFEGTTTRRICTGAGLSSAALYVHFASKEQLLYEISIVGHRGALAELRSAVEEGGSPTTTLRNAVHAFVLYHAKHHTLARVIQYELRVLNPDHFADVAAIRREIDSLIRGCIHAGVEAGQLACADIAGAALAIESLAIDVARWFQSHRSSRTPEQLAAMYAQFALQIVQAKGSSARRKR